MGIGKEVNNHIVRGRLERQRAFALPTVLITSIVMLTVLLAALTAASSISAGLKNQYLNQLNREAAQSGATMAKACMEGNSGAITWNKSNPLRPNTDCNGTESISCPNTSTDARCYVLVSGNYRTTFKVSVITDTSDNPIEISSKGIAREVRKSTSAVVYEGATSLKAKLPAGSGGSSKDGLLALSNGGTCVIAEASLYCSGYNNFGGQLAIGSGSYATTPTAVVSPLAGKTVTKVSASTDGSSNSLYTHTCAIADGSLYCWGYNGYYQVGNGNAGNQTSPVLIAGGLAGKTVTDVTTFNAGTCAIADGSLYCWGYSGYGQLGTGSTGYVQVPTIVAGAMAGKKVTKVSVSPDTNTNNLSAHSCAIADGSLYCWGTNDYYQVGNGSTGQKNSPVLIAGGLAGKTVTDVNAFNVGNCAIADGSLYCWGYSGYGQLGTGSSGSVTTPTIVAGVMAGKTVTKVSASHVADPSNLNVHTCAVADGSLYCWGYNGYYQLGNGNTTNQYTPVLISAGGLAGKAATDVIPFNGGTCAIADGSLYCWGYGFVGQLGTGSASWVTTPTAVASPLAGKTVTRAAASSSGDLNSIYVHTCAIADGSLYCWGYNAYTQLGDGSSSQKNSPVQITGGGLAGKTVGPSSTPGDAAGTFLFY